MKGKNQLMEAEIPDLHIDTTLVRKILVGFIKNEIIYAGFSKVVIGLSGGIDSALSCYLSVEALGPENVLAVRMPYKTSSQASLDHAQLIIDDLGIQSKTIEITKMADGLINQFPDMGKLRQGNIMARCRMITLYDQSAAFGGLVVGTGNKTEILLGYTTLFGDSACAINPIGDLYKAQVKALSRAVGVPEVVIDKPPTADLWAGQTDEDELGYTYEEVDRLLYLMIEKKITSKECIKLGFEPPFVKKVEERVHRNQFKRKLPPIAKITHVI